VSYLNIVFYSSTDDNFRQNYSKRRNIVLPSFECMALRYACQIQIGSLQRMEIVLFLMHRAATVWLVAPQGADSYALFSMILLLAVRPFWAVIRDIKRDHF
jgi:hypothetical protein